MSFDDEEAMHPDPHAQCRDEIRLLGEDRAELKEAGRKLIRALNLLAAKSKLPSDVLDASRELWNTTMRPER